MRHLRSWLSLLGVVSLFLGFVAVLWNGSITIPGNMSPSVSQTLVPAFGWGFVGGVLILVCMLGSVLFFGMKKRQVEPEPTARPPSAQPVPRPRVPLAFIGWYLVRVAMTPILAGVLWWLGSGHPAPRVFVAEVQGLYLAWEAAIGVHWTLATVVLVTLAFAAEWRVWWGTVVLGALLVFLQGYRVGPVPWPAMPSVSPFDNLDPWGAWLLASLWALCTYVGGAVVSAWSSLGGLWQIIVIAILAAFSWKILRLFYATGELMGVNQVSERRFTATYAKTLACFFAFIGIVLLTYYLVMDLGPEDPFWGVRYGRTGLLLAVIPLILVAMGLYLKKHMSKALHQNYWRKDRFPHARFPYKEFCVGSAIVVVTLGILSLLRVI